MHRYILRSGKIIMYRKMKSGFLKELFLNQSVQQGSMQKESMQKESMQKVSKNFMVEQGFTIIEMMVTLAILAILISLAAPSFVSSIHNNQVSSATNNLISSMGLARIEAVKSNATALIQSTSGTPDWSGGHRIGVDLNSDGDILDSNELLRVVDAPAKNVAIKSVSPPLTEISYASSGAVGTTTVFRIDIKPALCESGVTRKRRKLQLNLSGTTTLTSAAVVCP